MKWAFVIWTVITLTSIIAAGPNPARPPAVPLVTHDPYFSIWLTTDRPTDDWTKHWTGRNQSLLAMVRIDGKTFRLLAPSPRRIPAMPFTGMKIHATRTLLDYTGEGVKITMTFMSPLLAADMNILSRPITYVTFDVVSTDGQAHDVSLYFDACAEVAVNSIDQKVVWSRLQQERLDVLAFGCKEQQVLDRSGDDLRIDWGYFYLCIPRDFAAYTAIGDAWNVRLQYADFGTIPASDDMRMPREVSNGRQTGGEEYALIGALAYRQSVSAHKLVADLDGTPLFFPKENFSNGCISTVDVIYPSAPLFLLFQPKLLEAMLIPVFDYARSKEWTFPFAPHDLGTYPKANGQVYGGGSHSEKDQMPVEESGNMIIMAAALAKAENSTALALHYWDPLECWAEYLKQKGLDPEEQLCTDDFAGHLAHNANLSIKAIVALESFSSLCRLANKKEKARLFHDLARKFAAEWQKKAEDGDHYRLAFDRPGTWSQKYNLVWDKIFGFNLFPPEVRRREIAFYMKKQLAYGLPLDNRRNYTKLDWILWTATLAERPQDFQFFIKPVYAFLNDTPDRVPMTDWYWTDSGRQEGFQARSVVGGVFIKMLADPTLWKKWLGKSQVKSSGK